jgi:putative copper resistance protein D
VIAEAVLPLTGVGALTAWRFAPLVDGTLGVLAAAYLAAALRVRRQHRRRPWTVARTLAFVAGLAVIAVAVQSGAGVYDDALFSVHMVQHVMLIMVAPPLLVWGRPITLLMHAVGNPVHSWVKRVVRSPAVAALTWPPAAAVGYAVVVAGTHTPPVMDFVVRNQAAHDAEHVLYLLSGYLFFLLIVGSEPIRWRVPMVARYAMLLVAMQVDTVVGVVFMVAGHELFPAYSHPPWPSGPDPLSDLRLGGMVMWMGSDIVMVMIAMILAAGIVRRPAHRAGAGDRGGDLAAYNSYLAALDPTGSLVSGAAAPLGDLVRDAEVQRRHRERRERPVIGEGQADDQDGDRIQGDAVAVGQVAPPGTDPALPEPDGYGDEFHQHGG